MLVWVIIGYFSLFDLGLGRALTKVVSEMLAASAYDKIPPVFWTTLLLMTALGLAGGLLLGGFSSWLVASFLKIPEALHQETVLTLWVLALGIPVVILASALRGTMEAQQKFLGISLLRFLLGVYVYAVPLAVLWFTNDLVVITMFLVLGRAAFSVAHLVLCVRSMPYLLENIRPSLGAIRPLLSMGGWITVSNIIGPVMANLDRFFVGALVSIAAVAYYATPFDMVTRILLVPAAVAGVLFPAFSAGYLDNLNRTRGLFVRGGKYILFSVFPLILIVIAYAPEILRLWLGPEFSAQSFPVMQWLAVGVLANSLAQIPFSFLQGIGRADLTAKVHIIEVPTYLVLFLSLTYAYGILGTAVAWTIRVSMDGLILYALSAKFLAIPWRDSLLAIFTTALSLVVALFFTIHLGPLSKILLTLICLSGFLGVVWLKLLDDEERTWARRRLAILSKR